MTKRKNDLHFSEIKQVQYKFNVPMLIDKDNNVLLGNSNKELYKDNDEIKCIVCDSDSFIKETFIYIENVVAEENDENRLKNIDFALKDYLLNEFEKVEEFSLFSFKEYGTITEDNFIKPPAYNFEKAKRNKNKEEDLDYDDLFSIIGGM